MALSILSSAVWRPGGAIITEPNAGEPCWVGLAWGPGERAAVSTVLSIAGATIDSDYAGTLPYNNPLTFGGAKAVYMGWHPDNVPVYLETYEAAWGLWQVTFPLAQAYTATLSGITGEVTLTGQGVAAEPVRVSLSKRQYRILAGDTPSALCELSYDGEYPDGGFLLDGPQLGLILPLFGSIRDTPIYRFVWTPDDYKLRVYQAGEEVSGSITFVTHGLFQANSQ